MKRRHERGQPYFTPCVVPKTSFGWPLMVALFSSTVVITCINLKGVSNLNLSRAYRMTT